jgi:hypothetical protein
VKQFATRNHLRCSTIFRLHPVPLDVLNYRAAE